VDALERLVPFGMPCVQISRFVEGAAIDYVGNDHRRGTYLATEHLISLGHRRIVMIGGTDKVSTGVERRHGFANALTAYGIAAEPDLLVSCPPTREDAAATIREVLQRKSPPTAAVCYNDVVAFGVMLGLRQIGLEAGEDFAVAGCDDISEAALWIPALSTVRIDTNAMGEAAVQLLLRRLAEPDAPVQNIVLEPKLVVRASSGSLPDLAPRARPERPMSSWTTRRHGADS
jgi:LacI family transcriptional regulator